MNLVDRIRGAEIWTLRAFGRDVAYDLHSGESATVRAYLRGVRADDLFGAAMQQDQAGIIDAGGFAVAFAPRKTPARLDRLRSAGRTFSVEEWRGSPNDAAPVFFKLLLRGGSQ
jgi:hypothetical protein